MLPLLQAAAEAAPAATEAAAAMGWVEATVGITSAVLGLVLAILKILSQRKVIKEKASRVEALEVTEKVTVALMEAVDGIKPILGTANAKHVTGAIQTHAKDKGVLDHLDGLLAANGLNPKPQ